MNYINPEWITPLLVLVAWAWLRSDIRGVREKVDGLASDHNTLSREVNALSRELSEVKGFLRGTVLRNESRATDADTSAA